MGSETEAWNAPLDVKPIINQHVPEWREIAHRVGDARRRMLLREREVNVARLSAPHVPADPSAAAGLAWLLVVNQLSEVLDTHGQHIPDCVSECMDRLLGSLLVTGVELYTGRPVFEGEQP